MVFVCSHFYASVRPHYCSNSNDYSPAELGEDARGEVGGVAASRVLLLTPVLLLVVHRLTTQVTETASETTFRLSLMEGWSTLRSDQASEEIRQHRNTEILHPRGKSGAKHGRLDLHGAPLLYPGPWRRFRRFFGACERLESLVPVATKA